MKGFLLIAFLLSSFPAFALCTAEEGFGIPFGEGVKKYKETNKKSPANALSHMRNPTRAYSNTSACITIAGGFARNRPYQPGGVRSRKNRLLGNTKNAGQGMMTEHVPRRQE